MGGGHSLTHSLSDGEKIVGGGHWAMQEDDEGF